METQLEQLVGLYDHGATGSKCFLRRDRLFVDGKAAGKGERMNQPFQTDNFSVPLLALFSLVAVNPAHVFSGVAEEDLPIGLHFP